MPVEKDPSTPTRTYKSSIPANKVIELNIKTLGPEVIGTEINELCDR